MPGNDIEYCVSCNVRAYRVAHLLDADGDYEQARKVTQFGSFRWGGIFNVAIPMVRGKIEADWWEFLRWYDPDVILIHDGNHPDFNEPTDHGLLPFRVVSPNPPFNVAYPMLIDATTYSASEHLCQLGLWDSELRRGNVPLSNWRVIETEDAPHQEFLEANVGVVSGPGALAEFDQLGAKRVAPREGTLLWGLTRSDIEWSQLWQTGFQLRRRPGNTAPLSMFDSLLFVVSEQANVQDFCLFWSARASRIRWQQVYWVPADWADTIGEYVQTVAPSEYERHTKQVFVYLVSLTLPSGELSDLTNRLSTDGYRFEVASPVSVVQQVPDSSDVSTPTRTIKHPIGRGQASLVVPEPGPDFQFPDGSLGRWAVDITTEAVGHIGQGMRFPLSPGLADRMLRGELPPPSARPPRPPETEARVMSDGRLSIGVTAYNPTIFIDLLDSFSIFKHALQAHSFQSAARNVNYTLGRRALFQPSPRAYKTVERSHHGVAAMALANMLTERRDAQQLLVWNEPLRTLVGGTCSGQQIADMSGVKQQRINELFLPFLVKRRILLQGYYLKCTHCSTSAWYPLDDVGQQYRCSACLNMNQTPYKPEYSYKLVPLAERAVEYNQLLPLAAVALLAQEAKSDFIWEPELVLKDPVGAGFQDSDIDICCVRDGDLIIGETAWDGGFLKKDGNKLVRLARRLRPAEIVFGVMRRELKPPDEELICEVAERVDPYGTRVAVFLEHHLLQGKRNAKPPLRFVANPETHKVHRWTCRYQPKRRRKWFETYQDAAQQGYRPCKVCRPNGS